MEDHMLVTFSASDVEMALSAVAAKSAATTGRSVDWTKRRLREALRFCGENHFSHPEWTAHYALVEPVLVTAASIGGLLDEQVERLQ